MKLSTVNVVEMYEGEIIGLTAFTNNKEGNRDANIFYHDLIAKDDPNLLEEEIEDIMAMDKYQPDKNSDYAIKILISTK